MAYLRRWTVRTDPMSIGQYFWFYCYVYETPEELRKAAKKYSNDVEFVNTLACFQPSMTVKYNRKGEAIRTARTAFIGVMRLSLPIERFIVIHESVHAAFSFVRAMTLDPDPDFGNNIDNEEALAYAVHEISSALLSMVE